MYSGSMKKTNTVFLIISIMLLFSACRNDDNLVPDNSVISDNSISVNRTWVIPNSGWSTASADYADMDYDNDKDKDKGEMEYESLTDFFKNEDSEWSDAKEYQEAVEAYESTVGQGLMESYDYWLKADVIAMTPVLDKKGREVVDTKTRANIAKRMLEYYKNQDFIKYGVHINEQRDFEGAYQAFKKHIEMPDLRTL